MTDISQQFFGPISASKVEVSEILHLHPGSRISGSLIPTVTDGPAHSLGHPNTPWKDAYLSSGSLYIDGVKTLYRESGTVKLAPEVRALSASFADFVVSSSFAQTASIALELAPSGSPPEPTASFENSSSILFDGVDEYITFGNSADFDFERTDAFSISVWMKTGQPTNQVIWAKKSSTTNNPGYYLHLRVSSRIEGVLRGNGDGGGEINFETTTNIWDDGLWHHVVFTYDGSSDISGVSIYIDNVLQTLVTNQNDLSATMLNTRNFCAGVLGSSTNEFDGNQDELSVWNKELSVAEVSELWNSGAPGDLSEHSAVANGVSWWRMGDGDTFPTIVDQFGTNNGTMTNMEAGDIVTDVP